MSIFSRIFRNRSPTSERFGWIPFWFGGTAAGQPVNEVTAMQITAVYACVRVLSEAIAGLPLHIYRENSEGKEKFVDHKLFRLLHDEPNEEMTAFVFRETMMTHLLLYGNSYSQIVRNGGGQVISLHPLLPDRMAIDRINGNLIYTYSPTNGSVIKLSRSEILHIPGLSFDGIVGYSPIAVAKNAIGMAIATEDYGARFFQNGAYPGGILKTANVVKDPDKLRTSWKSQFSGKNSHSIAVLEEGLEYQQIGIPPEEAQFLETRKFQIEEIARIFRVPLHLLGDLEHATFSNIEHLSLEFVKFSLQPWVVRIEESMQQALILPSEKGKITIRFNLDGLLRGDYASRMQGYAIGIQNGFLSPDDVRALEEMNPIDGGAGKKYYFNGNMIPIEKAGDQYSKTTTTTENFGGNKNGK
jgi:HK97 family phage portal protein